MELELFEARAAQNLINLVTNGQTFTVPDAPGPHAPTRKRTCPTLPFNGKRQRHLSSSSCNMQKDVNLKTKLTGQIIFE